MVCFDWCMRKAGWSRPATRSLCSNSERCAVGHRYRRGAGGKFAVSVGCVSARRNQRNIKAMNPKPRHTWAAQHVALLGTNFDSKVSQQIGISTSAVQLKRSELNIQSYASNQ
ncbi:hypothetical protein ABH908_000105 [Pseudomonas frederiksbergensis]